ncbi:MAG: hypothetical protein R3Y62_02780, partial [Eubacteriales bacterium]
ITLAEDTLNVLTVTAGSYATVGVKAGNRVVFQGTGQLIVNNFGSGACMGGSGNSGQASGSITIEDGTYRLNPTTGAGIGGGYYGDGGEITINDGDITVTAPAETYSAGIGGGAYGTGGIITIGGGSINIMNLEYPAAIGGGFNGSGGIITIMDGTILVSSNQGSGIGGGQGGAGGTINISGGHITSTSDIGSCIGGGQGASGGYITVSGGYLDLMMGYTSLFKGGYGSCIGDGYDNKGATANFSTGTSGNAVIFAGAKTGNVVGATTTQSGWSCVFFSGAIPEYKGSVSYTGQVYGSPSPDYDLTIPRGSLASANLGSLSTASTPASTVNAALASGSYTLTGNVSGNVIVPAGVTATLDLNGYTISASSGNAITNNGNLTIQNGKVTAQAGGASALVNNGTLTDVMDVDFVGNLDLSANSKTTFTSGSIYDIQSKDSCFSVNAGASLTINGGTFYNKYFPAISTSRSVSDATISITGGHFTTTASKTYTVSVGGNTSLSITGGTFVASSEDSYIVGTTDSPVVLLGGTACFAKGNVVSDTTTLVFMGGYYVQSPTGGYMASGYSSKSITRPGDGVIYRYTVSNG